MFFAFGDQKACLRRLRTFFEKKVLRTPKNFGGRAGRYLFENAFKKGVQEKWKIRIST